MKATVKSKGIAEMKNDVGRTRSLQALREHLMSS